MASVADLVQAIARFEGFGKSGSLAERNNNPGNLRAGPRAIGTDANGYAIYRSAADGFADLQDQVERNINRGLSLLEFFNGKPGVYAGYAPAADNNDPHHYAATVASWLGISPDVPLSSALGADGANPFTPPDPAANAADLTAADLTPSVPPAVIEAAAVVGAIAFGWLLLPSRS